MNIGLANILMSNQQREKNFQEYNAVTTKDIAAKYPAFIGEKSNSVAACLGVYPNSAFNSDKSDQLNYIDFVNQLAVSGVNSLKINKSDQIKKLGMKSTLAPVAYNYTTQPHIETFKNIGAPPATTPASYGNTLPHQAGRDFISNPNAVLNDVTQDRNYNLTNNFDTGPVDPYTRHNIFANPMQGSMYNIAPRGAPTTTVTPPNTVVGLDQFIGANDPTSMYLTNTDNRPIVDFSHNNMVPFSTKFTQNMAGTGVRSGYDIDGSTFDSGADNSTPHQTKLSTFTGSDDTYLFKRETGPMFSPAEQQTGLVYGNPVWRADLDNFTQSLRTKNEIRPIESTQVGPGLDVDPNMPANGGFHDFTRVLPNNVSDYKANQLENRINAGKFVQGAELPASYPGVGTTMSNMNGSGPGVVKHRPTSYWDQTRRPTMTTKVANFVDSNMQRSEYQSDFRPKNPLRNQTSYGFGSTVPGKTSKNISPVQDSYGQLKGSW
jgi:hypothetical protein